MKRIITITLCFILCLGIGVTAGVFGYKYWNNIKTAFGFKTSRPIKDNNNKPNIEDTKDKIRVTFNYDDKETVVYVAPNGYAHIDVPVKDGWEFAGWYLKYEPRDEYDSGYEFVDLDIYHITEETTFYARYIKIHTVTFNYENGNKTIEILDEDTIDLETIEEPSKAGQDFIGWHIQGEEQGYVTDLKYYSICDNVVFEPVFAPHQENLPYLFEDNKITKYLGNEDGTLNIPTSYSEGREELNKYIFNDEYSFRDFIYNNAAEVERMCPLTLTDKNGQTYEITDHYSISQWIDDVEYPASMKVVKKTFIEGSDKQITEIGERVFESGEFSEVTMPNTIVKIDYGAFEYCSNLSQIQLSNTLRELETSVFEYCYSLKSLTLPASVMMAEGAFLGSQLESLTLEGKPCFISDNDVYSLTNTAIKIKAEYYTSYCMSWGELVDNFEVIGQVEETLPYFISEEGLICVYTGNESDLVIPESFSYSTSTSNLLVDRDFSLMLLSQILQGSYGSDLGLGEEISILFTISKRVLLVNKNYETLDILTLEEDYKERIAKFLGNGIDNARIIFEVNQAVDGEDMPITAIYDRAFSNNDQLETVSMPENIILGDSCFCYCSNLRKVTTYISNVNTAEEVNNFSGNVFEGCYDLEYLMLPKNIQIDDLYCPQYLKFLYIPKTVNIQTQLYFYDVDDSIIIGCAESSRPLDWTEQWCTNPDSENIVWSMTNESAKARIAEMESLSY